MLKFKNICRNFPSLSQSLSRRNYHVKTKRQKEFANIKAYSLTDTFDKKIIKQLTIENFNKILGQKSNIKLQEISEISLIQNDRREIITESNRLLMPELNKRAIHLQYDGFDQSKILEKIQTYPNDYSDIFIFDEGSIIYWNIPENLTDLLTKAIFDDYHRIVKKTKASFDRCRDSSEKLIYWVGHSGVAATLPSNFENYVPVV